MRWDYRLDENVAEKGYFVATGGWTGKAERLIGKKPAACSLEKSLCTDRGELCDNSRGRKDVSALIAQERSAFCLRELGGMGRSQRHPEAVENTREWGLG